MHTSTTTFRTPLAAAVVAAGLVAAPAASGIGTADARACFVVDTKYKTSKGKVVWIPTRLAAGPWQVGGTQSVSYTDGRMKATAKSRSDSVGGDAGVNISIVSASASYTHTWGTTTTSTTSKSQSYSTTSSALPKDQRARWTLYHKGFQYRTTVTVITNAEKCGGIKKHTWKVVTPSSGWSKAHYSWEVQLQSDPKALHS